MSEIIFYCTECQGTEGSFEAIGDPEDNKLVLIHKDCGTSHVMGELHD